MKTNEILAEENHPKFREGDLVKIRCCGIFASKEEAGQKVYLKGIIRGLAMKNVIDYWIVELKEKIDGHNYSCIMVPHTVVEFDW